MPKDEWGVKRVCPSCSVRFYDLKKDPMTCPSCGAEFDIESLTAKKPAARPEKKPVEPEVVVKDEEEDAVVLDDDAEAEDDADVDLDDEILDEDDDDDDSVSLEEIADVPAEDDDT